MIEYFDSKEKCDKLIKVAKTWLGTPYHHAWCCKGRGVDCSLLIAGVFKECGLLDSVDVPDYYPTDWHLNGKHILEETIRTAKFKNGFRLIEINGIDKIKCGDILVFSFVRNQIPHHVSLYLGNNEMIQATRSGVALSILDARYFKYLKKIYRVGK